MAAMHVTAYYYHLTRWEKYILFYAESSLCMILMVRVINYVRYIQWIATDILMHRAWGYMFDYEVLVMGG
jgi:hypothetical protein